MRGTRGRNRCSGTGRDAGCYRTSRLRCRSNLDRQSLDLRQYLYRRDIRTKIFAHLANRTARGGRKSRKRPFAHQPPEHERHQRRR
ncbi:MAG: hypothetical protein JO175_03045 [Candidatus Eremiobacteraeota bacterium]|nr:hypothetical protein [Candidatus Eremiobacteraeota bacterium]